MLAESDHKLLKKEVKMLKECSGHAHVLDFKSVHEVSILMNHLL
jgi:hypothetical protein